METARKVVKLYPPLISLEYCLGDLSMVVPKQGRYCFNRKKIDMIFGIVGHDNFIHRFRVVVEREGTRTNHSEDLRVKVIYLENEVIDCRLNVYLGKHFMSINSLA